MADMNMLTGGKRLRVACIGGGQLGRMMALEAPRLNVEMTFLDPMGVSCPGGLVVGESRVLQGQIRDADKILEVASNADVVTVEIEHVGVDGLQQVEQLTNTPVYPSSRVLRIIQDKYVQKIHFQDNGIPLPPFVATPTMESIEKACVDLGLPIMLKARKGAYDGRGNAVVRAVEDIPDALEQLSYSAISLPEDALYAEGWIDFLQETAVMVVVQDKQTKSYPVVHAIQQDSICRFVSTSSVDSSVNVEKCKKIAQEAVASLETRGVFGVELFVTRQGDILLNEVAPRPHNTGHYTQNACAVSQFENHLRAICGMPLGSTDLIVGAAAMLNILGRSDMDETLQSSALAMRTLPRATVHWYGKETCRRGRKMGHINLTADGPADLQASLQKLLKVEGIEHLLSNKQPLVGVIMGSQSDLPTMQAAVDMLKQFEIPYEVDIVSAHRTPQKLMNYAQTAASRGLAVIIAGAGGAAHLPGMVAAMTPLPVVGVPVKTSTLSGQDSLYSIVQMPRGVPVATVAIGNATNAGLLAVRILGAQQPDLQRKMEDYQNHMKETVEGTSRQLMQMGSDEFLDQMENKSNSVNV